MAPRRKSRKIATEPADRASFTGATSREYKIRLSEDVAQRIEAKAKAEGRPQNRIIVNELESFPVQGTRGLEELRGDFEVLLARYSARISWLDLSDELLNAVDAVLKTEGGAREAAIDKLRVVRSAMIKSKFDQIAKR